MHPLQLDQRLNEKVGCKGLTQECRTANFPGALLVDFIAIPGHENDRVINAKVRKLTRKIESATVAKLNIN
jgi:hypothetical protein